MDRCDCNLYWVALRDYLPDWVLKTHIHPPEEYHYIYVVGGTGDISIGNEAFTLTPGTMYLTAPGVAHGFTSSAADPLLTVELKFSLPDPELRTLSRSLPITVEDTTGELRQLLDRLRREAEQGRPYRRELLELGLRELMLLLLRTTQTDPTAEDAAAAEAMEPVLRYIRQNLHRQITLEDLAAAAHLEKAYFSRKFKVHTGCAPLEFVRLTRIRKAKDLLRFSDMSITQIGEALGFQSLHHFSKVFQKHTGQSPRKYKAGEQLTKTNRAGHQAGTV